MWVLYKYSFGLVNALIRYNFDTHEILWLKGNQGKFTKGNTLMYNDFQTACQF